MILILKNFIEKYAIDFSFVLCFIGIKNYHLFMMKHLIGVRFLSLPLLFTNLCIAVAFLIRIIQALYNKQYKIIVNSFDLPAFAFFAFNPNTLFIFPISIQVLLQSLGYVLDREIFEKGFILNLLKLILQQKDLMLAISAIGQLVNILLIFIYCIVVKFDKGIILFLLTLFLLRAQAKRQKIVASYISKFFDFFIHLLNIRVKMPHLTSLVEYIKNFLLSQRKIIIYDMSGKKTSKKVLKVYEIKDGITYLNTSKGFFDLPTDNNTINLSPEKIATSQVDEELKKDEQADEELKIDEQADEELKIDEENDLLIEKEDDTTIKPILDQYDEVEEVKEEIPKEQSSQ